MTIDAAPLPAATGGADPGALRAAALDAADPLAPHRGRFLAEPDVVAYLDGNSLGRPLAASADRLARFAPEVWSRRLIRAWDEGWLDAPVELGDEIARVVLGADPGTTVVGDSTTVLLYKLARAALAARPERREIVLDAENFPTDRFVLDGVAAETGRTLRWLEVDPEDGPSAASVAAVVGPDTALVVLSHVAYRSAHLADMAAISRAVHEAGALVLWDLSHSVGVVPMRLQADGADLAVGCTYKYLNGGPGSPAFAFVAPALQPGLQQPIHGWLGAADPFTMGERYEPAPGVRGLLSGTPPIVSMLAMRDMLALVDEVGMAAVRAKSVALTAEAVAFAEAELAPFGVRIATPRDPARRGSHVMLDHPDFREVVAELWREGVIPDFRSPTGLRVGLSPLSTGFAELHTGLTAIRAALLRRR